MVNLMQASKQWANRPADQRFPTVDALYNYVAQRTRESEAFLAPIRDIRAIPTDTGDINLLIQGKELAPTHWSFNQVCQRLRVPAHYLRRIPTELACENLNEGFRSYTKYGDDGEEQELEAQVYFQENGDTRLRAFTSNTYGRIFDLNVVKQVQEMLDRNPSWKQPPAYEVDGSNNAGLYGSDRDVWMFFVDEDHKIDVDGDLLGRGFFIWNSEVGAATLGITTFLYRYVCNNHIVWGAQEVKDIRIRHSRNAPGRFDTVLSPLNRYLTSGVQQETDTIRKAITSKFADTEDDVIKRLVQAGLQKGEAKNAVLYAQKEMGDAVTNWQVVQGVTAYARDRQNIDERVGLERIAGKLLQQVA